jgi:NTE family protein
MAFTCGRPFEEVVREAAAIRFGNFGQWRFSRMGLASNQRLESYPAQHLGVKNFEDLKIPLAVAATDFVTGEPVVFRSGPICDPVRASCAYPGMFAPVQVAGQWLVDGMLGHAVPSTPLREMGADYVIGIYLNAHWVQLRGPRHLFDVIGQCFSIAQARMSAQWRKDSDLVLEPDVDGFSYDGFDRSSELISSGERAMRAALPALKKFLEGKSATAKELLAKADAKPHMTAA